MLEDYGTYSISLKTAIEVLTALWCKRESYWVFHVIFEQKTYKHFRERAATLPGPIPL